MENFYTPKQREVLSYMKEKDPFITILHGAKRAGKTVINNDLFLFELRRVRKIANELGIDKPQYILAGNTLGSLQKNVLIELTNKYGIEFHMDKYNRFELFGVLVCCFGHGMITDMDRIRGITAFGAYINEGTTARNEVFKEMLNRCSGDGARIIVDTNPDNPLHWLKVDYVDKADFERIAEFNFKLTDNKFLSKRYMDNIRNATPSGSFYRRDIEGEWVGSEGVVYADFNQDIHVVDSIDEKIVEYIAGVDWGFEHYGSIVVLGRSESDKWYLLEEIAEQGKYIDWWTSKALELKEKYTIKKFYCDSARTEYVSYFKKLGVNATNANKAVIEGIGHVGSLLKQNKLFFLKSEFKKGLSEMYQYVWKTNASEDAVVKTNDDVVDSIRYALFTHNSKQNNIKSFNIRKMGL